MRTALAVTAAVLGVVAALAAAVLWTAGRDTLDEDRFADHAVASLVSTPGREALTVILAERLQRPRRDRPPIPSELYARARAAVDQVATPERLDRLLTVALENAYHAVVVRPGDAVAIDLEALSASLADRLEPSAPALAARLRADPRLSVTVSTGFEVPALPLRRLVGRVPLVTGLLALASAAFIAASLALSDRPGRTARRLASAFVLCAVVPAAIGLLVPRIAENAVDAPADQVARDFAERLLGQWLPATSALAVVAALLLALGQLRGGEGPRIRLRAG